MLEKTLLLIKPDGVARGLEKDIVARIGKAGLKIIRQRQINVTLEEAAELYSPHIEKSFYRGLINFITSGPIVANIVEGDNAIKRVRALMGATDPRQAAAGTIRGDLKEANIFTVDGTMKNLVHGSDSLESAQREMKIFFEGE